MKAIAVMEKKIETQYRQETIIRFEEGLIGFSEHKNFSIMEDTNIAPFRVLQCVNNDQLAFYVLDPTIVMKDYQRLIPEREWEALGMVEGSARLAFAICIIGSSPADSSGNFQAPILVNYKQMIGRQIILTDSNLSVRQPLLG